MFHVASRHAAPEALNLSSAQYSYPVEHKLNIPRRLARPSFTEPARDAVARLDPGLASVPLEYIKKMLAGNANETLTALSLLTIPSSLPCAHLPPSIDAPIRPSSNTPDASAFPTHVFAILSSRSSATTPTMATFADRSSLSPSTTVPLFPASALVMAVHCSLLPPLPQTHRSAGRRAALTLPIVPLTVPSPETYALLHAYLHTMRPDTLLASLLPSLASSLPQVSVSSSSMGSNKLVYVAQFSSDRLVRLASALAGAAFQRGGSTQAALSGLMAHIKVINGLWQNVCALGVFDAELWGVMDLAWDVVLAAMTKVMENKA
ncbi:hypothetical protein DICSQDRAFT_136297 [Dichomitus squalens LYAD-421 SS1]|uniref:Clp1-like protein n=1 Tax=Dichomitus squalens (strain LYAD-421) TaxID=732165 RepID=R7T0C3_DICSQ|nr:uncharacterized protein DICSQDRAFT_136297 [Dichomitus squalens LYAD-421 SS1]EJF61781.1 hypothetical protein DICSQDRAFT_136297 [Dichomitus squalens LYAD-421 SS1]